MLAKELKMNQKNNNEDFFVILLGTLGVSLLENLLKVKRVKARIPGRRVIKAGEEAITEGEDMIPAGQNF